MSEHPRFRLPRATRDWFTGTVLSPHVDAYVACLTRRGYATATVESYLRGVAHFAHWSARQVRSLEGIDEQLVPASSMTICHPADVHGDAFGCGPRFAPRLSISSHCYVPRGGSRGRQRARRQRSRLSSILSTATSPPSAACRPFRGSSS